MSFLPLYDPAAMGFPFLPACSNGVVPRFAVVLVRPATADQKDGPGQIKAIGAWRLLRWSPSSPGER